MRLGRTYEQAIAQKELPVRPVIRSRVRIGPRGFSLFLAIALASLIAYLFMSDDFYVYEAIVQGNSLVSAEEIYQSSGVQGYSTFFIESHQVEKAICSLPDVREAKVEVSLPNQMIVEVRERQAQVIWQTGQERYGVDEEGTVLPLRGEEPSISIRDLDTTPRQLGERIDLETIKAAERYKSLLPEVREFGYSQGYGLSLVNEHGWRIYLGNAEGAEIKVAIMKALVQRLASQDRTVEFIDVRFQESPYYRLAGG
jgi:cell division septal protein FtsQ